MNELSINTSQNVSIEFVMASLGERMAASLIDLIIKLIYVFSITYILEFFRFSPFAFDGMEQTVISFFVYAPVIFYSLVLESLFNGQTIGKAILKIKVIKIDGYQASFGDFLMRWILRIVELLLFLGLIAILVIIFNDKNQRLGDIVAGTAVISLRNRYRISHTFLQETHRSYEPVFTNVLRFSDNDIRIIRETYNKSLESNDRGLMVQLVQKVETILKITNPYNTPTEFIAVLLKDYNYLTSRIE